MSNTVIDLRALIRSGDTIFVGNGTSEPTELIAALIEIAGDLPGSLRVLQITTSGSERLAHASGGSFRLLTPAPGPVTRQAIMAGRADLLPASLGQLVRAIANGSLPIAGALVQGGPAAGDGTAHPGLALDLSQAAFEAARFRAIEVNEALPRIASLFRYDLKACDIVLNVKKAPNAEATELPSVNAAAIAANIAQCIPEGATLEAGIGRAGALLASALKGRRGMALYTGLITDAVMELIESGAVDRPPIPGQRALAIGAVVRGSEPLYRWVEGNPSVLLADARVTHAPEIMMKLPRFVALNGALQVDLAGNANSLVIDRKVIGGLGGAIDYATAGAYASGSVIALESTRRGQSCIVPRVDRVTVPGLFVTHVVTEHGVAALKGLSENERAKALISVAAPAHRDILISALKV